MKKKHKAFIFHSFMWKSVSDYVCAEPNFQKSFNRRVQVCRHNFRGGAGGSQSVYASGTVVFRTAPGTRCIRSASAQCNPAAPRSGAVPCLGLGVRRQALGEPHREMGPTCLRPAGGTSPRGSPGSLEEILVALRLGGIGAVPGTRAAHGTGLSSASQ